MRMHEVVPRSGQGGRDSGKAYKNSYIIVVMRVAMIVFQCCNSTEGRLESAPRNIKNLQKFSLEVGTHKQQNHITKKPRNARTG